MSTIDSSRMAELSGTDALSAHELQMHRLLTFPVMSLQSLACLGRRSRHQRV